MMKHERDVPTNEKRERPWCCHPTTNGDGPLGWVMHADLSVPCQMSVCPALYFKKKKMSVCPHTTTRQQQCEKKNDSKSTSRRAPVQGCSQTDVHADHLAVEVMLVSSTRKLWMPANSLLICWYQAEFRRSREKTWPRWNRWIITFRQLHCELIWLLFTCYYGAAW